MELGLLWAALAAAATSIVLGFLWFGLVFSKTWIRLVGWGDLSEDELKQIQAASWPGFLWSMAASAGAAVLLWVLFDWMHNPSQDFPALASGAILGAIVWAAGALPGHVANDIYEQRPFGLTLVNGAYWLLLTVLVGVYVALFADVLA